MTHLEVFLDRRGEPVLCEIGGRPGGGGIPASFHHRYGVALTEPALLGQLDRPLPSLVERQPLLCGQPAGSRSTRPRRVSCVVSASHPFLATGSWRCSATARTGSG